MPKKRIPKLCERTDGRAYATDPTTRKPVYFGPAGSPEAAAAYAAWLAGFLARPSGWKPAPAGVTVGALVVDYVDHAETYYRKGGEVTSEYHLVEHALGPLNDLFGARPAAGFTPLDFAAVRECYVAKGWTRETVNDAASRVKRCFRWGVETGRVPPSVWHGLLAVPGLKAGRTRAKERKGVKPVPLADLEAVANAVRRRMGAMIRLHLALCCRPEEVIQVRPCDLDRSAVPWLFVPASHKTEHHGLSREIWCGPEARAILTSLLEEARPNDWLFPRRPVWANAADRLAGHRTVDGYRSTVRQACVRAGVPHWSPRQVRHLALTMVRAKFGLEAAQHAAGHQRADVSQVYAERDRNLARRVAEEGFLPRANLG